LTATPTWHMKALPSKIAPAANRADPYYLTPEHRAWREAVIARAGGVCEWPGCGRREARICWAITRSRSKTIPPRSSTFGNGWCLCARHHSLKTARARSDRFDGPGDKILATSAPRNRTHPHPEIFYRRREFFDLFSIFDFLSMLF
jgi:hypothetical protein